MLNTMPVAVNILPGLRGGSRRWPGAESDAVAAIWQVVAAIPRGRVSTYGEVARAAGLPGRARLTGYALRTAPEELHLPWHRVVGVGGRISFPPSSAHHREQARRLRGEGVGVRAGRVDRTAFVDPQAP